MKSIEIQTDNREILDAFKKLAKAFKVKFTEKDLPKQANPSPSNDPYFDNPKNVENVLHRLKKIKKGDTETVSLSDDELKGLLGI